MISVARRVYNSGCTPSPVASLQPRDRAFYCRCRRLRLRPDPLISQMVDGRVTSIGFEKE